MTVDLLLFEVGGVRYGVDATQVRRVGPVHGPPSVGAPLGPPAAPRRALVFCRPDGREERLDVDEVLGVRSVGVDELRRLPPLVQAPPLAVGALLDGDEAVLLVDLHALFSDPLRAR